MAVDNSARNGGVKSEIDLYGDEDNYEHLHNEEAGVGDILDDFKQEDEDALLGRNENEVLMGGEVGEHTGGDVMEGGDQEDETHVVDRRQSETDDLLYDAVITDRTSPSIGRHSQDENGGDSTSPSPSLRLSVSGGLGAHTMVTGSGTMHQAQRKNSCYVGNLTWWTTDQDLTDVVSSVGITDLIDVKFYENRANGQSKGFALVSFDTEASVRRCVEHLPSKQIHGQIPVIMPYTKQSLAQFEAATRKPGERPEGGQSGLNSGGTGTPVGVQPTTPTGRVPPTGLGAGGMKGGSGTQDKNGPTFLGVLRIGGGGAARPSGAGGVGLGAPPQMGVNPFAAAAAAAAAAVARSSMGLPPGPPGVVLRGGQVPGAGFMAPGLPPPGAAHGFRPQMGMGGSIAPPNIPGMGPPPMITRPPPPGVLNAGAPPGAMMRGLPPGVGGAPQYTGAPMMAGSGGMPPPGVPPPGSHVNPNFYPGLAAAHQQQQQASSGHHHHPHHDMGGVLNEAEFEEIMNRNRTVSSSAISRAVSDAAAGDYASAIETLVTALSLIRQSKVAHDDRCKVLIGSLQDTLHGIEAKSYGSGGGGSAGGGGASHHGGSSGSSSRHSKDRSSARDRSRSRDRTGGSGGGSKRRHRSRSRSRSRDRYGDDYSPRRSRRY